MFEKFDIDKNQTIELSEMKQLLVALGNKPTANELAEAENAISTSPGGLNFEDFQVGDRMTKRIFIALFKSRSWKKKPKLSFQI